LVLAGPGSAKKYDIVLDVEHETSHSRVLRLVGSGKRVLDLGCAHGALAAAMTARGCEVVGVERDPQAAAAAGEHCQQVVVRDLDRDDLVSLQELGQFDVIVAADVLEHLSDPGRVLELVRQLLLPGGYVVTSIPNVAHGSVRLALLAGRFPYAELGLLDDTHLRFYTRSSMTELLGTAGLDVAYVEDQLLDAELGEVLRDVRLDDLPLDAREMVRADPDSYVYQFIAVSAPSHRSEGLLDALQRASVELDALRTRLGQQDTTAALDSSGEQLLQAQEQLLAARRAQSYLEVQVAHAASRISELEQHVERLTQLEVDRTGLETRIRNQQQTLEEIYASRLWRVGTSYRRALALRPGR
jgi:SAM-dependent methyltransferase